MKKLNKKQFNDMLSAISGNIENKYIQKAFADNGYFPEDAIRDTLNSVIEIYNNAINKVKSENSPYETALNIFNNADKSASFMIEENVIPYKNNLIYNSDLFNLYTKSTIVRQEMMDYLNTINNIKTNQQPIESVSEINKETHPKTEESFEDFIKKIDSSSKDRIQFYREMLVKYPKLEKEIQQIIANGLAVETPSMSSSTIEQYKPSGFVE